MFYLSLLPYVSLARTMSSFSLSRTPQLPSTLVYCTSLIVLRSHSRIPLRRIRSLVYIPPVLVVTTSELILLNSPSSLSEVLRNARKLRFGSGRLKSPLVSLSSLSLGTRAQIPTGYCHRAIFHDHFSPVFSTLSPTHSFISFTLPLLSLLSTLFSCYPLVIRLTTLKNFYDLMTIPFILFLFFIHTLSFEEMRTR